MDDNPDLLEAFAKRSLDDPDFYKAVQKGDLKELEELIKKEKALKKQLEELSKDPQTGKTDLNSISEANSILKAEKIGYIENPKRPNLKSGDPNIDFKIDGPKPFNWADIKTPIKPNKYQSAIDQATNIAKKIYDSDVMVIVDLKNLTKVEKKEVMEYILKYGKASKYNFLNY